MPTEWDRELNLRRAREAAYECMLEYGVNATTYERIAERSGLATRTLRRYFQNRVELVCDVMKTVWSERYRTIYVQMTDSLSPDDSGLEQLRQLHYRMFDLCRTGGSPWLMISELELFMYENRVSGEILGLFIREVYRSRQCTRRILLKGISDGSIRSDIDPDAYATLLDNTFVGMLQRMEAIRYTDTDYNLASFGAQVDLHVSAVTALLRKSSERGSPLNAERTEGRCGNETQGRISL